MVGAELGLGHDPGQHAAYVKSWIEVLRNDPMELFRAAADAEKIQRYVLGFANQHALNQHVEAQPHETTTRDAGTALQGEPPLYRQLAAPVVPLTESLKVAPKVEFAAFLRDAGVALYPVQPVMNGVVQAVAFNDDAPGARSGVYIADTRDRPVGYVHDTRTGVEKRWDAKGYTVDARARSKSLARAAEAINARAAHHTALEERVALQVQRQLAALTPAHQPTAHMRERGLDGDSGVYRNDSGNRTYVPGFDATGKHWATQEVAAQGAAIVQVGARREGCFHPVGGMAVLDRSPVILIAESYATARTLADLSGSASVAAFDSSNLVAVAKALRDKYPNKAILIAANEDRGVTQTVGVPTARDIARAAAQAVNGNVVFPVFAIGERRASPSSMRTFNDLASKSALGRDGAKRQIVAAVDSVKAVQRAFVQDLQLKQSNAAQVNHSPRATRSLKLKR